VIAVAAALPVTVNEPAAGLTEIDFNVVSFRCWTNTLLFAVTKELVITTVEPPAANAARPLNVLIVAFPGVPLESVLTTVREFNLVKVVEPVPVAPIVTLPVPVGDNEWFTFAPFATNEPEAAKFVNEPADAVVWPIGVLLTEPPVIATDRG
jgi:hypothetical protein